MFAEALAACGYQAKVNERLPEADIRRRMVKGAERLRTDQQFRQYAIGRSLASVVDKLETVIKKVDFVAELSNASPEATENLFAEELRQKFDFPA